MWKALWSCVYRFVEGFTLFSHDFISPATFRLINSMGGVNINYSQNIKNEGLTKKKKTLLHCQSNEPVSTHFCFKIVLIERTQGVSNFFLVGKINA